MICRSSRHIIGLVLARLCTYAVQLELPCQLPHPLEVAAMEAGNTLGAAPLLVAGACGCPSEICETAVGPLVAGA
jgi:hypothetical protein